MEKFDFSKIEDQKRFEELPKEKREEIVDDAQKEAERVREGLSGFIEELSLGSLGEAIRIKERFSLPEDVVQQAAKEELIISLSTGHINNALNIKEKFDIPEEFLLSAEVQQAAKEGFIKCLSKRYIDEAIKIKEKFSLPEDVVQQA
ncbi:MAG: hypothetical protein AAB552_01685, partial [Patescibacteria group bacterium]